MPKIERGRLSGFNGMESHTADELYTCADKLETQIDDHENTDDPKWLQRWAGEMRRLASQKEKAKNSNPFPKRNEPSAISVLVMLDDVGVLRTYGVTGHRYVIEVGQARGIEGPDVSLGIDITAEEISRRGIQPIMIRPKSARKYDKSRLQEENYKKRQQESE